MKKALRPVLIPVLFSRINSRSFWHMVSLTAILLITGCWQTTSEKSSIVKLYGNGSVANFSQNYYLYSTSCHLGQPGALMISTGDMLWLENWIVIYEPSLKSTDGAIHFIDSDSLLLLNGKIAGIEIDSAFTLSKLVDLNNKESIRQLKVISITHEGFVAYKPELEKIALSNPGCFLSVSGKYAEDELQWLFDQFDPTVLMIELSEQQQSLLAGEPQLQTLYLFNNDSIYYCKPLPNLPKLRDFYFAFDGNEIGSGVDGKNWLKTNPQIKNLTVTDWEEAYPKGMLDALEAPEVLIMGGMDIPAEEILAHSNTLKRVIVDSAELQLEMAGVKEIMVFNTNKPQTILNSLSNKKPDCIALDLYATDENLDLSPLLALKNLKVLTLIDADSIALGPLKQMKQLKLLSYSTDSTNMDSAITVLQTALPDTVVVANEGFCMGSGWLLLSIPAILAAIMIANKKREHKMKYSNSDTA